MTQPYSYHTFLYPFAYDCDGKEFPASASSSWEKIEKIEKITTIQGSDTEAILQYNKYQYFFPKARENLFNTPSGEDNKGISEHYRFKKLNPQEFDQTNENSFSITITKEKEKASSEDTESPPEESGNRGFWDGQ